MHAAIEEDTTAVAAVETTQELMPMMANRCSNGRLGSPCF